MHIIANTLQGERVKAVYINGKKVLMPFELDTDEGWVDAYVPKLFGGVQYVAGEEVENMNYEPTFEHELVRLEGTVVVEFKEDNDE